MFCIGEEPNDSLHEPTSKFAPFPESCTSVPSAKATTPMVGPRILLLPFLTKMIIDSLTVLDHKISVTVSLLANHFSIISSHISVTKSYRSITTLTPVRWPPYRPAATWVMRDISRNLVYNIYCYLFQTSTGQKRKWPYHIYENTFPILNCTCWPSLNVHMRCLYKPKIVVIFSDMWRRWYNDFINLQINLLTLLEVLIRVSLHLFIVLVDVGAYIISASWFYYVLKEKTYSDSLSTRKKKLPQARILIRRAKTIKLSTNTA